MPILPRPRILLLIPHLGGGGAERVIAHLARGLSREKYELHLGLITPSDSDSVPLPDWITVHRLGATRVRSAAGGLLLLVRRLRPQLILSGMFHLNFLVLLLRPLLSGRTRVLIRQNGTVSSALASGETPFYTRTLYRFLYRRADRVLCQTSSMADDLARTVSISAEKIMVLPNPVDVDAIRDAGSDFAGSGATTCPHLLSVGRLTRVKGLDLLLDSLALVKSKYPAASLSIVGGGAEEIPLKAQCRRLGLENSVHFHGEVSDPARCFAGATLFVLSSRHEGLPNALLEAAAGGLPIVTVPASGGLVDLLQNRRGVWLASEISSAALAESLLAALEALKPGQRFDHSFIEPFRMENSIKAYEDLLDSTLVKT